MRSRPRGLRPRAITLAAGLLASLVARAPAVIAQETPGVEPTVDDGEVDLARYVRHALTQEGDPERGREIFFDEDVAKCSTCHRVGREGGEVGPDLSAIGGKFDRPHLIESVLEPSRQIVEGYRARTLVLRDGTTVAGVVRERDDSGVRLAGSDGGLLEVQAAAIVRETESEVSIMPAGIAAAWTPDQFADLVAFLESLRPAGSSPGSGVRGALRLERGLEVEPVAVGISGATALEALPDGRVLVCEQTGALRVVRDGRLLDEPALTLEVDSTWERGLIGVTVHPDFPEPPWLYVCYVSGKPHPHHRVSRFTMRGDRADPKSEVVLLEGDDQRGLGGSVPAGHQGGAIHFGPDGKLYVAIGEQTAGKPSQALDTFQGKVLRIDPDGGAPRDNPFVDATDGKYRAIWARGLRNPYTFAFAPGSGDLYLNDVGGKFEEINRVVAGGNYGWPVADHGPVKDDRFLGPVHWYPQASIAGGDFVPRGAGWPEDVEGRYVFADFVHGWIRAIDVERPKEARTLVEGVRRPVDLRFGQDGALWVLSRNAWVIDGKFEGGTGTLYAIRPR